MSNLPKHTIAVYCSNPSDQEHQQQEQESEQNQTKEPTGHDQMRLSAENLKSPNFAWVKYNFPTAKSSARKAAAAESGVWARPERRRQRGRRQRDFPMVDKTWFICFLLCFLIMDGNLANTTKFLFMAPFRYLFPRPLSSSTTTSSSTPINHHPHTTKRMESSLSLKNSKANDDNDESVFGKVNLSEEKFEEKGSSTTVEHGVVGKAPPKVMTESEITDNKTLISKAGNAEGIRQEEESNSFVLRFFDLLTNSENVKKVPQEEEINSFVLRFFSYLLGTKEESRDEL